MKKPCALHCRKYTGTLISILLAIALLPIRSEAQLSVATVGATYTIDFDATVSGVNNGTYVGTGFQPTPAAGRADSDAWQISGFSAGNLAFGGTRTTPATDYTRGVSGGGTAAGGLYAFNGAPISGNALGVQPVDDDFTPGTIVLRIQNTTGSTLTAFDIAYNVFYRDDQARSNSFNFSYSSNNVSYTSVPALDLTSPAGPGAAVWTLNARSTTISGLSIANNAYFYIRWRGDDVSGAGSRDEFALDDIQVTGQTYTMVRFTGSAATVGENGVSTVLILSITNPDATNATLVDVVLISGSAARINGYTTQTKTFPAGSGANQIVTITITDNGTCDLDAIEVFQLQSISGGNNAAIGSPGTFTLTVDDNETGPVAEQQHFDGGVLDLWPITLGAGNVSSSTGATDTPANQRVLSAATSWQLNNATSTLELGTVSVLGWSSITLSARLSSTSTSGTNGADAGDQVLFYVDLNGGGFPGTPDITISGNNNARWGYSTGTGVASTTAGTPASFAPAGGGNRTSDGYSTINITIPNGTNTVALRVVANNNAAAEVWNLDNMRVTGTLCQPIYYSRGNGSQVTTTWATTRTGLATAVTFDQNASMVVQFGNTITTSGANFNVRSLNVETGSTLNLGGTTTLGVYGPVFDIDATFTSSDDNFNFNGTALQTISGTAGTITVNDLTQNGTGILVDVNTLKVNGTLQLNSGNFNANSKEVQLISTATGTARLGPVAPAASYTSKLRIERYIPAGVTDWRLICSPMQGKTIYDWTDDFITSGFTGTTFPSFSFNSVLTYDETDPGPNTDDGLVGATNVTNPLTIGQGFAAWSGTTLSSTSAFVIDVRGDPQIANTPVTLPMTWTNNGFAAVDGLNLVGNPVPSPIDFSLVSLGADVDSFYYVFDPGSGTNASWDEVNSLGTGGANGNIQSCQGFWLHATGPAVTTAVSETAKVLEPLAGGIFSLGPETREMVRVKLTTAMNDFSCEALVHFINGDPALGERDIPTIPLRHPEAPMVATIAGNTKLNINAMGPISGALDIPLHIEAPLPGVHTLHFSDVGALLESTCLTLMDLVTGTITTIEEGSAYTFIMDVTDANGAARFVLHMAGPANVTAIDATCAGLDDGSAIAQGSGVGPWDYTWRNREGEVISQQSGLMGPSTLAGLAANDYSLTVEGGDGCAHTTSAFTIGEPVVMQINAKLTHASCSGASDGSMQLEIRGGEQPYTYAWSNGATTGDLSGLHAGDLTVIVTDAKGCTATRSILVGQGADPVAVIAMSVSKTSVHRSVLFQNLSEGATAYLWEFGDGTSSTLAEPMHSYAREGVYRVDLIASNGSCSSSSTMELEVRGSQSISAVDLDAGISTWTNGNSFFVEWSRANDGVVQVGLYDLEGRLMAQQQRSGGQGVLAMSAEGLANGAYIIRVTMDGIDHNFKVPLAH